MGVKYRGSGLICQLVVREGVLRKQNKVRALALDLGRLMGFAAPSKSTSTYGACRDGKMF